MPCSQGSKGRDHNPEGFTSLLAGGGFKGGLSYGATDEWSFKAVENPTYCYDLHATVLHLLGIDHTRLTYRHNGIDANAIIDAAESLTGAPVLHRKMAV